MKNKLLKIINEKLSESSKKLKIANENGDILNAIKHQALCNEYIEFLHILEDDKNNEKY